MVDNKRKEMHIKKAGLLLYYKDQDDIYFRCMIPSNPLYGGSAPQIPKGGIEEGDTIRFTAIKECVEECGLVAENLSSVEEFRLYPKMKMAIYIGMVNDIDNFVEPHWESKWSGWVCYNTQRQKLRDIQRHIFDDVVNHLNNIEEVHCEYRDSGTIATDKRIRS